MIGGLARADAAATGRRASVRLSRSAAIGRGCRATGRASRLAAAALLAASAGASFASDAPAALESPLATEAKAAARPGDVLFKSASGLWGRLAARANADGEGYAHVGIVAEGRDGSLIVVHAGGDPSRRRAQRSDWRVRASRFEAFLEKAKSAALYRPMADDAQIARALAYARAQADREAPFDHAYSLGSERDLYCTELIWRALLAAVDEDPVPEKSVRLGRTYIMLDDLAASPLLALIWRGAGP
jgi:hypothetical protein